MKTEVFEKEDACLAMWRTLYLCFDRHVCYLHITFLQIRQKIYLQLLLCGKAWWQLRF